MLRALFLLASLRPCTRSRGRGRQGRRQNQARLGRAGPERRRAAHQVFPQSLRLGPVLDGKENQRGRGAGPPGAKRITMRLMRNVSAKQLTDALELGIRSNTSAAERESLQERLGELTAIMNALQSAKEGDLIALDWLPETGTRIVLNGESVGRSSPARISIARCSGYGSAKTRRKRVSRSRCWEGDEVFIGHFAVAFAARRPRRRCRSARWCSRRLSST